LLRSESGINNSAIRSILIPWAFRFSAESHRLTAPFVADVRAISSRPLKENIFQMDRENPAIILPV